MTRLAMKAPIEADRPDKGEFRIHDTGVGLGDHHRAGMQIAMDQRLRLGQEAPAPFSRISWAKQNAASSNRNGDDQLT